MSGCLPPGVYAILPPTIRPRVFDTTLALQDNGSSGTVSVSHTSGVPTVKTMLWIITGDGCITNLGTRRQIVNYERNTKVSLSDEDQSKFLINVGSNSHGEIDQVQPNTAWTGTIRSATPELAHLQLTSDQRVIFTKTKGDFQNWAFIPANI